MSQSAMVGLFVGLVLVSVYSTFKIMGRASKGYDKAKKRRADRGPQVPCSTCQSTMDFVGLQEIGVTQDDVAGGLGAAGGKLPVEVHRCPTCRKVEFFLPPSAG